MPQIFLKDRVMWKMSLCTILILSLLRPNFIVLCLQHWFSLESTVSVAQSTETKHLFSPPPFPPSLPWPQQAPVIVSQQIYDNPERPSICLAPTQSAAVHSFEDRTEENEKKKKKGSAQPQQILQTVFLFADLGGFHNNNDHNRRNEDFTKHGDWTTESIICNRRAHEPLLMAFTESPAQMIFTLMSEHSTLETHMP